MNKQTSIIVTLISSVSLVACGELPPTAVHNAMAKANVPGLTVATIKDCKVDNVSDYGFANISNQIPVTASTLFEAASLTKTIFALIVNQLADEGVIDLDEPLAATFAYPRVVDQEAYGILTPRIILEHRSGLPNWAADPTKPETWGEIEFKNPPNTKFGYSGEAFQLLQAYVENVTGKSLSSLFEERLGDVMPDTALAGRKDGMTPALGHDENGGAEEGRPMGEHEKAGAAFSAQTTAQDYASFLAYLCNGAGMSEQARDEMLRAQSPTDDGRIAWALGWGVQIDDETPLYFHWGDNGQFKAFTAFDLDTRKGVIYFANGMNGLKLIEPIAEPVVGDLDPVIEWLDYGRLE